MNPTRHEMARDASSFRDYLVRKISTQSRPLAVTNSFIYPALIRVGGLQTSTTTKPSSSQAHAMISTRAYHKHVLDWEGLTFFLVFAHGLGHDLLSTICSSLSGPPGENSVYGEERRANAYEWFG